MELQGKKLGLLLSISPDHPNFARGLNLAEAALAKGLEVYLYCIDDAIAGIDNPRLQSLRQNGVRLYGCAYAAHRRNIAISERAIFAGLTIVSDLIAATDRFVSFN